MPLAFFALTAGTAVEMPQVDQIRESSVFSAPGRRDPDPADHAASIITQDFADIEAYGAERGLGDREESDQPDTSGRTDQRQRSGAFTPDRNDALASIPVPNESDAGMPETLDLSHISRALQGELRRVGCHPAAVDGGWNLASRRALERFNKYAGTRLDVAAPSLEALDVVRSRNSVVCPVTCARGYYADERGGCTKITCKGEMILSRDGTCKEPGRSAALRGEPEMNLPHEHQPVRGQTEGCSFFQNYMHVCSP